MSIVKKRMEKYFPDQFADDIQNSLLNTIRVPKSLLYLTDRLPKPKYEDIEKKKRLQEELNKRKTYDAG